MTVRNLDSLFKPASVALCGASEKPGSLGCILLENLLRDFQGEVYPVNPSHKTLLGRPTFAAVSALPEAPDLAIIATPPDSVPDLVDALAKKGTRGVCVITAGFSTAPGGQGPLRRQAMLDAAKSELVRIVGPNCVGLQIPRLGLNASFASVFPHSGSIAFVAQSGAVITAVLDWAYPRGIGFSHVVSLGDMADVDFGDMLDYLANDENTDAILLYIEAITHARKFMSAARAAARSKPVIVVKGGRQAAGAKAATSHTGALAGMDAVYDAAFRRAGILRVLTLEDLFDAVETLATARMPQDESLTILTNGGGLGVLAADALMAAGGELSELSEDTLNALDQVLPATWSRGNPVDIIGDARGDRYAAALAVLLRQPEIGALLVLNCPTALASSDEVATALINTLPPDLEKTVLTSWTGEHSTRGPRARIQAHGIPTYDVPEDAVAAFMQMLNFRHNQQQLLQTPPSLPVLFEPREAQAREIIASALTHNHEWLSESQAKQVLAAYGIATVITQVAADPAEVGRIAIEIGAPVAVKILSPDITHKSDAGGVSLNVSPANAAVVAKEMSDRIATELPAARLNGFTVQPMVTRKGSHELIAGMINDAQFGPVMLFGHGGTAVEIIDDKALALPPLNLALAHDMIQRTRIYRLLQGYRNVPPVPLEELAMVLVRLSHLIVDMPQIQELDINPLLASSEGIVALDARIRVAGAAQSGVARLAILPYPKTLEDSVTDTRGNTYLLRPVLPEDELQLRAAFAALPEFAAARLTQIDYDRQMALVLTQPGIPGTQEMFAMARLQEDPDRVDAQLQIAVTKPLRGRGLGRVLLAHMLAYARDRGIGRILVRVPPDHSRLEHFYQMQGFNFYDTDDQARSLCLTL